MGPPGPASHLLPPLVLALAGVARGSLAVLSWPRVAVVPFGGSVSINCSHSACAGGAAGALALLTPLAATPGPAGTLWQSFRLDNVSRWTPGPVTCSGRCGDTEGTASSALIVYQLPRAVSLDPVPAVAEGDSHPLRCHVLEVAPLSNLTVTLRRGPETLRTATFGDSEGSASVAVTHVLTVTRGDHGQQVTCHAELSLRPHGPLFARAAAPVTLSVFALPDPPQLQAPPILELGTSANVTCRISGAFPVGDIRVTAALGAQPLHVATELATGDTVTAMAELSPLQPGQHELSCTARVAAVAKTARRKLRVYRFPEPLLELRPGAVAAGEEVTVTCHVGDTPELLGDSSGLAGDTPKTPEGTPKTHGDTPKLSGDTPKTPEGTPKTSGDTPKLSGDTPKTSEDNFRLPGDTPGLPGDTPKIEGDTPKPPWDTPKTLGDNFGLPGDSSGSPGDTPKPHEDTSGLPGDTLKTLGDNSGLPGGSSGPPGDTPKTPGDTPKTSRDSSGLPGATPKPLGDNSGLPGDSSGLHDDTPKAAGDTPKAPGDTPKAAGDTPKAAGDTPKAAVSPLRLQLRDARGALLAQGAGPRLQLRLVTRRRDHGRQILCRARLAVGDREVTKEAEARLEVLYPPEFPPGSCPPTRTWLGGSRRSLSCLATGNPSPTVACGHRGVPVATTEPWLVTRSRAGTYECKATNALGTRSRRVTVRVEHGPSMSESRCPARRVWVEGQRWHLECGADGEPAPSTSCEREGGSDGGVQDGGAHGGTQDGGAHGGAIQDGGTQDGGTRGGIQDGGAHGGIRDGGDQDGSTHGGIQDGGAHGGGIQDGAQDGSTRGGGTHDGGTHGGIQDGGTHGGIQDGGTHGGTHHSENQDGGTHGGTHGGIQDGGTHGGNRVGGNHGDTHHGGTRGGTQDGGTHGGTYSSTHGSTHGGIQHGGTQHSSTHGGIQDGSTHAGTHGRTHGGTHGDTQDGGTHSGIQDGSTYGGTRGDTHDGITHGGAQDGGTHSVTQDGGTNSGIQDGGTHDGTQDGRTHGGIQDGGTHGGTQHGGTHGGTRGDTRDGGTQDGGIQDGGTQDGGTHIGTHGGARDGSTHGDTQHGGNQDGGTHGSTQDGGTHRGTQNGGTQNGGTHGGTQNGGTHRGIQDGGTQDGGTHGGRVVTRADGGRYVCRARNRHGEATRSVLVTVEYPPGLPELGCPERRRWLEGTPARLRCEATGNPPPVVTCARIGDYRDSRDDYRENPGDYRENPGDYRDYRGDYRDMPNATELANVTRGHAGTYECRASNAHGWASKNVSVDVEYPPSSVTLRVLPSPRVAPGSDFSVSCGAGAVPAPRIRWALPPAPNARWARGNRSVLVTAARAENAGSYRCEAGNAHGSAHGSVVVTVEEPLALSPVPLVALGAGSALGLLVAAGCCLKSRAGTKGEYNVSEAEGSRDRDRQRQRERERERDRERERERELNREWNREWEQNRDWERGGDWGIPLGNT